MRKWIGILGIFLLLYLSGCASVPDLSREDEMQISQYAAHIALQNSRQNPSRIVDISDYVPPSPVEEVVETEEEDEGEDVEDIGEGDNMQNVQEDVIAQELMEGVESIAAFMNLEEYSFSYDRYEYAEIYPYEIEDGWFMQTQATQGKTLLVVHMTLTNLSDLQEERDCNINETGTSFQLITDVGKYSSLITLLEQDMGTYIGTFMPQEQKELVLLFQVSLEDAVTLESLQLRMVRDQDSKTIQLY